MLSNGQKNNLFESIRKGDFDPRRLRYEEGRENDSSRTDIEYMDKKCYFTFWRLEAGRFRCLFYPSSAGLKKDEEEASDWKSAQKLFDKWLNHLNEWVTPDLWGKENWLSYYLRKLEHLPAVFIVILVVTVLTFWSFKDHESAVTAFLDFLESSEEFLGWLLALIMLTTVVLFIVIFFKEKYQKPTVKFVEKVGYRGARVFFMAAAAILLIDAGVKISLQILEGKVEPVEMIDVIILSIVAVTLISMHEVLKLLLLSTKSDEKKAKELENKSTHLLFVVLFTSSVLAAGLCLVRKMIQ